MLENIIIDSYKVKLVNVYVDLLVFIGVNTK